MNIFFITSNSKMIIHPPFITIKIIAETTLESMAGTTVWPKRLRPYGSLAETTEVERQCDRND